MKQVTPEEQAEWAKCLRRVIREHRTKALLDVNMLDLASGVDQADVNLVNTPKAAEGMGLSFTPPERSNT